MHTYQTIEAIRAAAPIELQAWCERNDSNGDFDGMAESDPIALRAIVAHMLDFYETIEDALAGEGY